MIIQTSRNAYEVLRKKFNPAQEEVYLLSLNAQLRLLSCDLIFRGTIDHTLFHPRDIFRVAINKNAHSIIVAHNHPSQNALPSMSDKKLTRKLLKASELLEIPLLDHVIFCSAEFYSLSEKKLFSAS